MKKYLSILIIALLFGCTEIPPEIPRSTVIGDKAILIEDITGVKCTNCPAAAAEISNISEANPGKVIAVAIHAPKFSTFTKPTDHNKYDFRIAKADEIVENLGDIQGLPSSAFDRYNFSSGGLDGTIVGQVANYNQAFNLAANEKAQALISIENTYDENSRQLNSKIDVEAKEAIEGELYITLYVLESHLIDYQVDKVDGILDYEHNHVLRDVITSPLGDLLEDGMSGGEVISKDFSYTIPTDTDGLGQYIPENMDIVAFVHRKITGQDKVVLQASIAQIIK